MNIPHKRLPSNDDGHRGGYLRAFETACYPNVDTVTDEMLQATDSIRTHSDVDRLRSVISGDPIGDYVGRRDLQEIMLAYEHAALRLGHKALQQIDQ